MRKILSMSVIFSLFPFFCCCNNSNIEPDDEDIKFTDESDEDEDRFENDDDKYEYDRCTLDMTWMTPEDSWPLWGYLKMMGEVGEYDGEYVPAVFTDGKIKLTDTTTELTDGFFINYRSSVLLADAAAYEFTNVNQNNGTAVLDYWDAVFQFNPALIPSMKEAGAREAGFGATAWLYRKFIDIEFNQSGVVTAQFVRKNCLLGLSKTEEVEEQGEVYDIPVGDIYGCFEKNVDGSVGEELIMMFKNEFTDDEYVMLEFLNTQANGTVIEYGQDGYIHLCTCYKADGLTEVNCWNEYDGPGGAEECPAVVEAADECGTVEADDDVVNDEDTPPCIENGECGSSGVCYEGTCVDPWPPELVDGDTCDLPACDSDKILPFDPSGSWVVTTTTISTTCNEVVKAMDSRFETGHIEIGDPHSLHITGNCVRDENYIHTGTIISNIEASCEVTARGFGVTSIDTAVMKYTSNGTASGTAKARLINIPESAGQTGNTCEITFSVASEKVGE